MIFREYFFRAGDVLLSVETSSTSGGLSFFKDQKLLGQSSWGPEKTHSETLTQAFQDLIRSLNLNPKDISDVLCVEGPGSFTGLRVGLNFAKSVCFANDINITLTPSYRSYIDDSISLEIKNLDLKSLVLLNAYKNQLFVAEYRLNNEQLSERLSPTVLTPEEIGDFYKDEPELIVLGDGFTIYADQFSEDFKKKCSFKDPEIKNPSVVQAQLYFQYDHCLKFNKINPLSAEPLYIKKSEAEENLNRGQIRRHTQRKL